MRPQVPFDATTTNSEVFRGWQLPAAQKAIGLEIGGDRMFTLIPKNAPAPYTGKQVWPRLFNSVEIIPSV